MNTVPTTAFGAILYASSLTAVMSIACLSIFIAGWMLRDTWRDRFRIHPKSLLFGFRMMMTFVGGAAFVRCMPEVLYLQTLGDNTISNEFKEGVIVAKRVADVFSFWLVLAWQTILAVIYPHLVLALGTGSNQLVRTDALSIWPRLMRPLWVFCGIVGVAVCFAYAKVYYVH